MLLLAVARGLDSTTPPEHVAATLGALEVPRLRIYTLGRFAIELDGKQLAFSHKLPKKPLELLRAVIAHGGRAVTGARISGDLWPDARGGTALQSFNVTLHRLRKLLGVREAIEFRNGQVRLNPKSCWVDTWAFERTVDAIEHGRTLSTDHDEAGIERFDQTLDLYHGPFLARDADAWILPMREKLRAKFIRSVRAYAEHCERIGQGELAVKIYERAIEIDPQAEELYRRLMTCDATLGRASEALAVFRRCQHALRSYLGVEPGVETRKLYSSLLNESSVKDHTAGKSTNGVSQSSHPHHANP